MATHTAQRSGLTVLAWVAAASVRLIAQQEETPQLTMDQRPAPVVTAAHHLQEFKAGGSFRPPSSGLVVDGRVDRAALALLEQGLLAGSAHERENIVELLFDIGFQCMHKAREGAVAVDDADIVRVLADKGAAQVDAARERAMELMRKHGVYTALAREGPMIARALEQSPSREVLLLVARAKAIEARPIMEELASDDEWRNETPLRVARAALGDTAMLAVYFEEFKEAKVSEDVRRYIQALNALALIGTPASLLLLAEELRTPLVQDVEGSYERSVRLVVLEGLVYNYPDEPALYPNRIITEADFREAEEFCERTLGATYDGPVPPFMTYRGHPEPLPGEK